MKIKSLRYGLQNVEPSVENNEDNSRIINFQLS